MDYISQIKDKIQLHPLDHRVSFITLHFKTDISFCLWAQLSDEVPGFFKKDMPLIQKPGNKPRD